MNNIYNRIYFNLNKTNNNSTHTTDNINFKRSVSILYHGNISFTIKRILSGDNIRTAFRVKSELDKIIQLGKDPMDRLPQSNVIYIISCQDCEKTDFCETGRLPLARHDEYKKNINLNDKYDNVTLVNKI